MLFFGALNAKDADLTNLILVPERKERLGDRLYGQILEQIASGILQPGDKLPSENKLCGLFNVSRPVVRQALVRLQADGLVVTRKGLGTVVKNSPPEGLTRFSQPGEVAHMLRCLELRLAVEGQAAAWAATRHSPAELRAIGKALEMLEKQIAKGGITAAADFAFHLAVAAASGNVLFEQVLQSLDEAIRRGMVIALGLTPSFFLTNKTGAPHGEKLGRINPLSNKSCSCSFNSFTLRMRSLKLDCVVRVDNRGALPLA